MSNDQLKDDFQEMIAQAMRLGMEMAAVDHSHWLDNLKTEYPSLLEHVNRLYQSVDRVVMNSKLPVSPADVIPLKSSMEELSKIIEAAN